MHLCLLKVNRLFRWDNISICIQKTHPLPHFLAEENVPAKILSYNRANRAVAILCNHQRAPPKTFEKSMQNLQAKVDMCFLFFPFHQNDNLSSVSHLISPCATSYFEKLGWKLDYFQTFHLNHFF